MDDEDRGDRGREREGRDEPLFVRDRWQGPNKYALNHRDPLGRALICLLLLGFGVLCVVYVLKAGMH